MKYILKRFRLLETSAKVEVKTALHTILQIT